MGRVIIFFLGSYSISKWTSGTRPQDYPAVWLPGSGITRKWDYPEVRLPGSGITLQWDYPAVELPRSGVTRPWDYSAVGLATDQSQLTDNSSNKEAVFASSWKRTRYVGSRRIRCRKFYPQYATTLPSNLLLHSGWSGAVNTSLLLHTIRFCYHALPRVCAELSSMGILLMSSWYLYLEIR